MLGFGFISTPSLLLIIPDGRNQSLSRCQRIGLTSPFRTAPAFTLHTVLCTNSEPPRKRGRPKGSRNKAKLREKQEVAAPNYPELGTKSFEVSEKQDIYTSPEPREISTLPLIPTKSQPAESSPYLEAENTPTPVRKRGRPRKQKVHRIPSDTQTAPVVASVGNERNDKSGTKRSRGRPYKPKGERHENNDIISPETGGSADGTLKASDMPLKRKRGRPRSISVEVERMIVADSMKSISGNTPNSAANPRKRGRPRGSKNKPKSTNTASRIPFDIPRDNIPATTDEQSELDLTEMFEMYNKHYIRDFQRSRRQNWKEENLRAPNGLPESGPEDLIFELMPIFAKLEAEKNRIITEKEKNIRRFIDKTFHQFASSHRSDRRQLNLKPFKLREDEKKVCAECEGVGMLRCEYCEGFGFVDFGENGEKFYEEFGTDNVTLPKQIMGTMYHCPSCDGSTQVECSDCSGTGSMEDLLPRKSGASRTPVNNYAKDEFDIEKFLEEEKDRVEIGLDGTIVLRARRRRGGKEGSHGVKRKSDSGRNEKQSGLQEPDRSPPINRSHRSSPAMERLRDFIQKNKRDLFQEPSNEVNGRISRAKSSGTDFINTTDFKVGRNLRNRKPIHFSSKKKVEKNQGNSGGEQLRNEKLFGQEYRTENLKNL
ncbi:unnamed protein product [Agarophyton chilense]|eukprot:gb/GEZJ01005062.1/.p1 GENE.gb/GEZJ01005062.1/~~gb/GEZJ01005062.1/.p1  ORF type:complete len:655 (-),score=87.50 gb/GEZJ01005062.1/:437-2401(-)